jgi:hypothetical protein
MHADPGARASRLRRDIMSRTEPAMLDMWGSEWASLEAYELQPMAQRYEQYEVAFAAKVIAWWNREIAIMLARMNTSATAEQAAQLLTCAVPHHCDIAHCPWRSFM